MRKNLLLISSSLIVASMTDFFVGVVATTENDKKFGNKNDSFFLTNLCPLKCNAANCDAPECSSCEFTCGGGKCYLWRDAFLNSPRDYGDGRGREKCSVDTTFTDVTPQVFEDPFWNEYPHMGRIGVPEAAPTFLDVDGDGILDYFMSSHLLEFELGLGVPAGNGSDVMSLKTVADKSLELPYIVDPHGATIIDLDNDGYLDILVSNGGGSGGEVRLPPYMTDNNLLWGKKASPDKVATVTGGGGYETSTTTVFKGKKYYPVAANLNHRFGRGRTIYNLDVNGDGLLDVLLGVDRRKTNEIVPGILLINNGNRTFTQDTSLKEYHKMALLTDVDGDGHAEELVINRDFCFPERKGPEADSRFPSFGPYSEEILKFCSTRPVGTTAVYKYDKSSKQMKNIGRSYTKTSAANDKQPPCCFHGISNFRRSHNCFAKMIVSADLDGDLIADHIFMYMNKMVFYFSTDREPGTTDPFGDRLIGAEVYFPRFCYGLSIRVQDWDNDGKQEILVMCLQAGKFYMYTQGNEKGEWTLKNGCNNNLALGDVHDLTLSNATKEDYRTVCEEGTGWVLRKVCRDYRNGDKKPTRALDMSTADLNNDGYMDLVVAHNPGRLLFFYNRPSGADRSNRFIGFILVGKGGSHENGGGNVYGIGATVILYAKQMACPTCEEETGQFQELSSVRQSTEKKDERIIFGLGKHGIPTKVVVRWSNHHEQTVDLTDWTFTPTLQSLRITQCFPSSH